MLTHPKANSIIPDTYNTGAVHLAMPVAASAARGASEENTITSSFSSSGTQVPIGASSSGMEVLTGGAGVVSGSELGLGVDLGGGGGVLVDVVGVSEGSSDGGLVVGVVDVGIGTGKMSVFGKALTS